MKTSVDMITGALSDTRTRYLGKRPVSLFKVHDNSMLLALSSKPWLGYIYMSKYYLDFLKALGIYTNYGMRTVSFILLFRAFVTKLLLRLS